MNHVAKSHTDSHHKPNHRRATNTILCYTTTPPAGHFNFISILTVFSNLLENPSPEETRTLPMASAVGFVEAPITGVHLLTDVAHLCQICHRLEPRGMCASIRGESATRRDRFLREA